MAMLVARSSGAGASTHRMLSRKKGRQYGEGHQKALQISVRMLPLVGMPAGGRERSSCEASEDHAPCVVSGYTCLCCLVVGSALLFPHDGGAGKECDALSGHEAAEMSSPTLL